jgi:hypothetical protein
MLCRVKLATITFFHLKGELKKLALKELRLRGKGGKGKKRERGVGKYRK